MTSKPFHLLSGAEDKYIELFIETFSIENTQYIAMQYPFVDIYGNKDT